MDKLDCTLAHCNSDNLKAFEVSQTIRLIGSQNDREFHTPYWDELESGTAHTLPSFSFLATFSALVTTQATRSPLE